MSGEGAWIESDSFDRRVFSELFSDNMSLQGLAATGEKLIPYFRPFLQDLFCALFKYNIVFLEGEKTPAGAEFQRWFLETLSEADALAALREQTVLDEVKAGVGTLLLAQMAIDLLKSELVLNRKEMLEAWEMRDLQDTKERKEDESREIEPTLLKTNLPPRAKQKFREVQQTLNEEQKNLGWSLKAKSRRRRQSLDAVSPEARMRVQLKTLEATKALQNLGEDLDQWERTFPDQDLSLSRKLEIGKKLVENPKLKRLALLVGRLRDHARALRRRVFERASEEMYEIAQGGDLARLIPSELVLLRRNGFKKEFFRRFADQKLLQYEIKGEREHGKGPLVVCVDVSSSMAGENEIWAKAIALALMDIARKQKRAFRTICFSSQDQELWSQNASPADTERAFAKTLVELAEYFPGGGTDFQRPLQLGIECLQQSRYRKGDLVLITDGQAEVAPDWAEDFHKKKKELGFFLYSILIDLGATSCHTLAQLSDRVTAASRLSEEGLSDLFIRI